MGGPEDPGILEITSARPPRTCFNGPISAHRSFSFGSFSPDTVKAIKNEAGVRVNDGGGGLRRSGARVAARARRAVGRAARGDGPGVRAKRGRDGDLRQPRVDDDRADPDRRGRAQAPPRARELLGSAKEHHAALPADVLTDASSFIPPAVAALGARTTVGILGRTRPPLNLVVSNVPGPRSPLYIARAQLQAHYPVSAVLDGWGSTSLMSYLDHVDFGIVADRDQTSNTWPLLRAAEHAVDELAADLLHRGAARPSATDSSPAH